jgi:hypothetical protein
MAKKTNVTPITEAKKMATEPKAAPGTGIATYVNPKALSTEVGQKAVMAWKETKDIDNEIATLEEQNQKRKGAALKLLTMAFIKAATNDKTIVLEHVYKDKSTEQRELRQKMEVAIGLKVVKRGEDGVERYELAPWTADVLPQAKEDRTAPGYQAKDTFRANFAAAMTKCIKAAHAVVQKGIELQEDKATGHLIASGKAIKERFKVDQVMLNEKREMVSGGKEVKLDKIPSFTELARISAESMNRSIPTRAQSAKEVNPLNEKDMVSAVNSLTTSLGKLKYFGDELATAIEALAEACDEALQRNGSADEEGDAA